MAQNPIYNEQAEDLLFGGNVDPTVTAIEARRGTFFIYAPKSPTAPQVFQKQDDGATTNWTGIAVGSFLPTGGGTMSGNIDMGTNSIINMADPTNPQDAATKNYVDTTSGAQMNTDFSNAVASANAIDLGNNLINNVTDPVGAQDAATKNYVDTADALRLLLAGGTMTGNIAMGTNSITGLADPVAAQDASTKNYVDTQDALKLSLTGGTMSGAIDMGTNLINNVTDPVGAQDAATKNYVDTAAFANQTLSNLSGPTSVNQNLAPDAPFTRLLGTSPLPWGGLFFNDATMRDSAATADLMAINRSALSPSGATGPSIILRDSNPLNIFSDNNAVADASATENINIETGNKTAGTGDSGDIILQTGTSLGGSRGAIRNRAAFNMMGVTDQFVIEDFTGIVNFIQVGSADKQSGSTKSHDIVFQSGHSEGTTTADTGLLILRSGEIRASADGNTGAAIFQSGDVENALATGVSGGYVARSGNNSGSGNSGTAFVQSGTANTGASGDAGLLTGNVTAGTNNSGSIFITTGTSFGGTRGDCNITSNGINLDATTGVVNLVTQVRITNVADPTGAQDVATKNYVDTNEGANTTLSNLTSPTSVNQDLIPSSSQAIGSSSSQWGNSFFNNTQWGTEFAVAQGGTSPSGLGGGSNFFLQQLSAGTSLNIVMFSANNAVVDGNPTAGVRLETGNKTAGTGDSGDISLQTGTSAGGTRGRIEFSASVIDHNQVVSDAVVWQSGVTGSRPGGPVLGQRFFDTTLGIPIWFDGTNWIDAAGTTV